jgi:hypothetical protein
VPALCLPACLPACLHSKSNVAQPSLPLPFRCPCPVAWCKCESPASQLHVPTSAHYSFCDWSVGLQEDGLSPIGGSKLFQKISRPVSSSQGSRVQFPSCFLADFGNRNANFEHHPSLFNYCTASPVPHTLRVYLVCRCSKSRSSSSSIAESLRTSCLPCSQSPCSGLRSLQETFWFLSASLSLPL